MVLYISYKGAACSTSRPFIPSRGREEIEDENPVALAVHAVVNPLFFSVLNQALEDSVAKAPLHETICRHSIRQALRTEFVCDLKAWKHMIVRIIPATLEVIGSCANERQFGCDQGDY
jgi:hypothetical protein